MYIPAVISYVTQMRQKEATKIDKKPENTGDNRSSSKGIEEGQMCGHSEARYKETVKEHTVFTVIDRKMKGGIDKNKDAQDLFVGWEGVKVRKYIVEQTQKQFTFFLGAAAFGAALAAALGAAFFAGTFFAAALAFVVAVVAVTALIK